MACIPSDYVHHKTFSHKTETVEIWTDGTHYVFRFGVVYGAVVEWLTVSEPTPMGNHE